MNNKVHLKPVGATWARRLGVVGRAGVGIWRGAGRPVGIAVAVLIVLFVIADRLVPQRIAYIVDDLGRHAWSVGQIWIGPYSFSLPSRLRTWLPKPFYAYAANRQSAQAQVDAAGHWAAFPSDDDRDELVQVWLYGAFAQGYLPAIFELREQHNSPDMKVFRANVLKRDLEQWRQESGSTISPEEIEVRAIDAGVEHRLNHGALALAAKNIHRPGSYGWDGLNRENIMPGELKEMRRRARQWFDFDKPVEAAEGVDCDDYAAVFEVIIDGQLQAIRTCIDRKRANPMSYDKWRKFLDCTNSNIASNRRSGKLMSPIEVVVACEKAFDRSSSEPATGAS